MTEPDEPTQAMPRSAVVAGRYRLDRLVGRGGTAEVWQATDTSLDRTVALKLVTAPHDASAARAADEARTLAQLSHPHLVQVYDAGTDATDRPWVVMEFVDGQTLAAAIREKPLALQRISEIGADVADALAHVHARGLVHRDVKPANVLLSASGSAKLTDFGIARLVDSAKVTGTGLMVGTASYLAPEQVSGQSVGPAVDVYALGLVLLEAITGTREYDGPAVEAAMARLHRDPQIPTTLPTGWADLLRAMTAQAAQDRPSAQDVARAFRGLQHGQPTRVLARPTTLAPAPAPAPAPRPRRLAWIALAVAAALALAGVGLALTRSGTPTPRTIPPVSTDLPPQLQQDLQHLVDQVAQQ